MNNSRYGDRIIITGNRRKGFAVIFTGFHRGIGVSPGYRHTHSRNGVSRRSHTGRYGHFCTRGQNEGCGIGSGFGFTVFIGIITAGNAFHEHSGPESESGFQHNIAFTAVYGIIEILIGCGVIAGHAFIKGCAGHGIVIHVEIIGSAARGRCVNTNGRAFTHIRAGGKIRITCVKNLEYTLS